MADLGSVLVRSTILCLFTALLIGSVVVPAAAGDGPAVITADPETLEIDPGETVEVDVHLESHGGYGPESRVESVRLLALAHPEYLTVTDVEPGSWLEGEETEVRTATTVREDGAVAEALQYREPAAGGTTNDDRFATLTLSVPEDAPPSTATLEFDESGIMLTDDYPQPIYSEPLTVEIDGGGDHHETYDHGDLEAFGNAETFAETGGGSTVPDDLAPPEPHSDDSGEDSSNGDDSDADSSAGIPLGLLGIGVVVLVAVGVVGWAATRSTPRSQN